MSATDTSRISPTAHYTAYVWYRNGMSHPALRTRKGWMLFNTLQLAMRPYQQLLRGPTIETTLLQRHRIIDHLLTREIEAGRIGQVVEIASGLSPRGYRFATRYAREGLVYVEGDLPDMAATKQAVLDSASLRGRNHHVLPVNALVDDGPYSMAAVGEEYLDPNKGTAVITEGLVNYFSREQLAGEGGMWARIARTLTRYPRGAYFSDLHLAQESNRLRAARMFRQALSVFARGEVHLHFGDANEGAAVLDDAGFTDITLHRPSEWYGTLDIPRVAGNDLLRVVDSRVGDWSAR